MVDHNREVDQAITSLTAEILKLAPMETAGRDALQVTIANAFTRMANAILAQVNQSAEKCQPLPTPETAEAIAAGNN